MPPSPRRDYTQWFSSAILPYRGGDLSPKGRAVLRLDQDLRHLFGYLDAGLEDIEGRGEYGELKASPEFYQQLACEFMDFAALHPDMAARVLADVFRLIEMQPMVRENILRRRRSMERLGV